jgi:hypothetical protein
MLYHKLLRGSGNNYAISIQLDQLMIVSCGNIVTLHANVPGAPLGTHYDWIQLTGSPVTWLSPTTDMTVMYRQEDLIDDKTFEFFVNRGTLGELHAEILVTAIPREYISAPSAEDTGFASASSYLGAVQRSSQFGDVVTGKVIPGLSSPGTVTVDNPLRGLMFASSPTVSVLQWAPTKVELIVEEVGVGQSPVLIATLKQYAGGYFNFAKTKSLRVDTKITSLGRIRAAEGPVFSYAFQPKLTEIDTFDPFHVSLTGSGVTSTVAMVRYSVVALDPALDSLDIPLQRTENLFASAYSVQYSLTGTPSPAEDTFAPHLQMAKAVTSTHAYTPLGIGGLGG